MQPPVVKPPVPPRLPIDIADAAKPFEGRNLWMLSAHYVALRIGWIFKTESVIIPGFLDAIAGAGWIRGCLPVLSRIGLSGPPLLLADSLRRAPLKKLPLVASTVGLACIFTILSLGWFAFGAAAPVWLPAAFLLLYFVFFCFAGMNNVVYSAIQGKLIRPVRRGRLMTLGGVVGSAASIAAVCLLLPGWLTLPDRGFGYIFGFTAFMFFVAAAIVLPVAEYRGLNTPRDRLRRRIKAPFVEAWQVFAHDPDFRRVAIVGMLFNFTQLLFPHYQALGRAMLPPSDYRFLYWVVAQNAGAGVFSVVAGPIADRFGNRLALRIQCFAGAATPLLALALLQTGGMFASGQNFYWATFILLGATPITLRTLMNYTLELAPESEQPRYLSTLSVCLAAPYILAVPVGWLIDLTGFEPMFVVLSCFALTAAILTWWSPEPRER